MNALLLNTIKIPTPTEIAKSATLKIALKKRKFCPPQAGSQEGGGIAQDPRHDGRVAAGARVEPVLFGQA